MQLNLAGALASTAARLPAATALRHGSGALSWAELDDAAARAATVFTDLGVRPGDRVALMLPNIPDFPVAYYGALRAGAVVVPLNVLLKRDEIAHHLTDSSASVLVAWAAMADEARLGADGTGTVVVEDLMDRVRSCAPSPSVVRRRPEDTAVLLYTSGTTGRPKGAQLTHSNLMWNAEVMALRMLGITDEDALVGTLPLFHSFGQTAALNVCVLTGARLHLVPRFDPAEVLSLIAEERPTVFLGVPTMYSALLAAGGDAELDSLRLCISGGSALPEQVLHDFEARFGCRVLEGYGLSETSPVASFNHLDRPSKPGSIGTPMWGVEMRLGDPDDSGVGEIQIRGHNIMNGYWNAPEATAAVLDEDGWFSTGDLARVDEDGYYFIVDRKKDLIIRGGYNVYPREVEEVLYGHPEVHQAAVVGVPHAELGEEVAALVVPKPGADPDPDAVREWVKERVAAYKYPRTVRVVDALPLGPTGKVLKRAINLNQEGSIR